MITTDPPLIVFVDVDDTLVRTVGKKRIPIIRAIEHVRQLHKSGAILYCWSTAGEDYAKASAEELGITNCFVTFLPKPNVLLDDQLVASWRSCIEVHPSEISHEYADEYWKDIKENKFTPP